jgi:hypothetical protein
VIPTVAHDVLISYVVGHVFAVARRTPAAREDAKGDPCFRRALAFQLLVFVPIGIFLLAVLPSWSFFYLFDPVGPWFALRVLGIAAYVAAMVLGYRHGASLAARNDRRGSVLAVGAALAVAAILFVAVARRFFFLGSYEDFQALNGSLPANFFEPANLAVAALIGLYFTLPLVYVLKRNWKE